MNLRHVTYLLIVIDHSLPLTHVIHPIEGPEQRPKRHRQSGVNEIVYQSLETAIVWMARTCDLSIESQCGDIILIGIYQTYFNL